MKRIFGFVFLCGAASCVSASASSLAAAQVSSKPAAARVDAAKAVGAAAKAAAKAAERQAAMLLLAPADEYFGPLNESIIGIRNTIGDLGKRYDVNHDIPTQTISSAKLQERAIRDWEHRYPRDPQVPRAVFLLQRLYTKVLTQDSRNRAHATALWLFADFARSPQAHQLRKMLAVERLSPLPDPSPEPSAVPTSPYSSVFGQKYPTQFNGGSPAPAVPSGAVTPVPQR